MNYIKGFFSHIISEGVPYFLNLLAFSIAFAAISICLTYTKSEIHYDAWINDSSNAYRAHLELTPPNSEKISIPSISPNVADILAEDPYVKDVTRLSRERVVIENKGLYYSEFIQSVDPNFLRLFGLKLKSGDLDHALEAPNTAVLTPESALKYFGHDNPLGKTIILSDNTTLTITGVLDSLPVNTHLDLNIIVSDVGNSTKLGQEINNASYGDTIAYTYFWLKAGAPFEMVLNNLNQRIHNRLIMPPEQAAALNPVVKAMPVTAIHLNNLPQGELKPGGSYIIIIAFFIVAVLLIIILSVNYTILCTHNSQKRFREYGIKRALGASVYRLIATNYIDSLVTLILSALLGFCLVFPLLKVVYNLLGIDMRGESWTLFLLMFPAPIIVSLITALIMTLPARSIFKLSIRALLLNEIDQSKNVKRILPLVMQYFATSFILIVTVVVSLQTHYALYQSVNKSNKSIYIVDISGTNATPNQIKTAKDQLLLKNNVNSISGSIIVPTNTTTTMIPLVNSSKGQTVPVGYPLNVVDDDFFKIYGISPIAGRSFSSDMRSGSNNQFIVSESAARKLGFFPAEQAIGQSIGIPDENGTEQYQIIGVVPDLILKSVDTPLEPLVYMNAGTGDTKSFLSIELTKPFNVNELSDLAQTWKQVTGDTVFEGSYLQMRLKQQYRPLNQAQNLFTALAFIALLTSSVGIYAYSSIVALKQRHEIGIRRALGATKWQIARLMFARFLYPILAGVLLAVLPAYMVSFFWLNKFTYHIELGLLPALLSILITFVVGVISISYNLLQSSRMTPSKALRWFQ